MRYRAFSGFTLIELLVSISILSALLLTGSFTYQLFSNRWDKDIGTINDTIVGIKNINLLRSVLKGINPLVIEDEQSGRQYPVYFFVGKSNSLLAASKNGLFTDDELEVFRLSVVEKDGFSQLVYQASSTNGSSLLTTEQELEFDYQVTLLENLSSMSFSYLGYEHFDNVDPTASHTFISSYSGINQRLVPFKVKIDIDHTALGEISFTVDLNNMSYRLLSLYLNNDD